MKIELNSNKEFLIKLFLPFAIIVGLAIISLSLCFLIIYDEVKDCLIVLIELCALEVIFISIILCAKYCKDKNYEFTEKEIIVYKKEKQINRINVTEIESISYYSFKFRYLITIFAGALNEGGVWKLHIKYKDGTKESLEFFAINDVKRLKEQIYGELITIV